MNFIPSLILAKLNQSSIDEELLKGVNSGLNLIYKEIKDGILNNNIKFSNVSIKN
jgi:hypothetical protein